jgi:hypothetical protein
MNDETLKAKLMGWSATVGLTALALLGHTSQSQAVQTGVSSNPGDRDTTVTKPLAAQSWKNAEEVQVAGNSWLPSPPPPPPPPSPPAVGGVRG